MTATCTRDFKSWPSHHATDITYTTIKTEVVTDFTEWELVVTMPLGSGYSGIGSGVATASPTPTSTSGAGVGGSASTGGHGSAVITPPATSSTLSSPTQTTVATSAQSTGGVPRVRGNAVVAGIAGFCGGVLLMA
jgi:hypothetical protein